MFKIGDRVIVLEIQETDYSMYKDMTGTIIKIEVQDEEDMGNTVFSHYPYHVKIDEEFHKMLKDLPLIPTFAEYEIDFLAITPKDKLRKALYKEVI